MNDFDKPVVVVLPGDLHLTEPRLENVQAAHRVVDDVNILIRPNFVQFIGDNDPVASHDDGGESLRHVRRPVNHRPVVEYGSVDLADGSGCRTAHPSLSRPRVATIRWLGVALAIAERKAHRGCRE
jgi:hypothetical protein